MTRRRSHDGVSWKPPTIQDPKTGLYCRRCSSRHGYNGTGKLKIYYTVEGNQIVAYWMCPKYNYLLAELLREVIEDENTIRLPDEGSGQAGTEAE